jgi:hypothetical protein
VGKARKYAFDRFDDKSFMTLIFDKWNGGEVEIVQVPKKHVISGYDLV